MTTTEQFLVGIGIDPRSVRTFLKDVEKVRNSAEGGQVDITVTSNAGEVTSQISSDLATVDKQATEFTDGFTEGLDDATDAANELQKGLLAIAAAAAVGFAAAIKFAAEEGRNLAQANAILKLSTEELNDVQTELRQIATETGLTFQNVSGALFDVASSGRRGADALEAIRAAALVAAPGGAEVVEVYSALDAIMKNFGVSASEAADALVQTAEQSVATISEVADSVALLGPVASAFGIAFEEIAGAIAAVTGAQVNAAIATTQIRALISTFISPAKELAKEFERIGITVGDTAFRTQDLADKLRILQRESARGNVQLGQLFDRRALAAAARLVDNLENFNVQVRGIVSASGAAAEAFQSFRVQASVQLDEFRASVINAATAIGSDLLETVRPFLEFLTDFINENRALISILGRVVIALGALITIATIAAFVINQISAAVTLASFAWTRYAVAQTVATFATAAFETVIAPLLPVIFGIGIALTAVAGVFLLFRDSIGKAANASRDFISRVAREFTPVVEQLVEAFEALIVPIREVTVESARLIGEAVQPLVEAMGELGGVIGAVVIREIRRLADLAIALVRGFVLITAATIRMTTAFLEVPIEFLSNAFDTFKIVLRAFGIELDRTSRKAQDAVLSPVQQQLLDADAAALQRFNRIIKESGDVSFAAAFQQATSSKIRIEALRALQEQGNISVAQEQELADLTADTASAGDIATTSAERLTAARKNTAIATDLLNRTQEETAKIIAKTEKEIIAIRQGSENAQIVAIRNAGLQRIEILRANATAQIGLIESIRKQIAVLNADESQDNTAALNVLRERLANSQAAFSEVTGAIADNLERFNSRVIQAGTARVNALEELGRRRVENARKSAEEVIKANRSIVTEAEKDLEKLKDVRDRELAQGRDFLQQLRDQETGRRDPALLALQRLEREAMARLAGASVDDAAAALQILQTQVERLTQATEEQTRVNEQLEQVRARIRAGQRDDRDTSADVQREAALTERLVELEARRVERATAAQGVRERLGEITENAAEREEELSGLISAEEEKIRAAKEQISIINTRLEAEEQRLTDQKIRQVAAQKEFNKLQLEALRAAEALSIASVFGSGGGAADRTQQAETRLQRVTQLADEAARRSTETSRAVNLAVQEGRAIISAQTSEFQTFIDQIRVRQELESLRAEAATAAVTEFQTATERVAASAELTATAVSSATANVEDIGSAQEEFGTAVENGFSAINTQLSAIGTTFERQASDIRRIERQIANQNFDSEGADASASGLS